MKKYIIGMVAIILAVAGSAFTAHKTVVSANSPNTTAWFTFMGSDPTDLSQVQDNTNYTYVSGLPCSGSSKICAVQTSGVASSGHQPDPFTSTLKTELQNVINSGTSYPDISKKP